MPIRKPLHTIRELTQDMMEMPPGRRELYLVVQDQLLQALEGRNAKDYGDDPDVLKKLQRIRAKCIEVADPCGTRSDETRRAALHKALDDIDGLIATIEEAA